MKLFINLLCLLLLFGCSSSEKYAIEDQQYNCLKEKYQENENADLDELVLEFENQLIEQGFLKDHSSASFLKCLESMTENKERSLSIPLDLSKSISLTQRYSKLCQMDMKDSILLANSRFAEVQKEIQNVFDEVEKSGDLNLQRIAEGLAQAFKQEDFDHTLYRLSTFPVVSFLSELNKQKENSGILGGKNRMSSEPISEKWQMSILIDNKNKIFINNKEVAFDDFSGKVDQFFTRSRTESKQLKRIEGKGNYALGRAFISFGNDRETDYDFYLKVYKQLEKSYTKVLNKLAKEVFNQPFDQLNKKQQKSIKELQPWMVSESEPTRD